VAEALIEGLLVGAEAFGYRIPGLYSGEGIDSIAQQVPYPGACRPQAWSAAASFAVVGAVRKIARAGGDKTA
jgi:glycogen debranching enzyme